jgi:dihydroorotase
MDVLRQVRVLDPVSDRDQIADVLIDEGTIKAIEPHLSDPPDGTRVIDQPGLILGPGLVDLYSHSGEPGFESRETLQSIMASAIAGGFTRVALLPDTHPAVDTPAMVEHLKTLHAQVQGAVPQVLCWGAITEGVKGEQMTELGELAASHIVGFADGQPLQNWMMVRRILEYAYPLGKPIALWCCDRQLTGNGVVREGTESIRLGLPGSPAIAESVPLAALLECVAAIGTPVHLMRLSTQRGVELVRAAKAQGLPITASTTWAHLMFDITAVRSYDTSLRLDPPLGNPTDRMALIQGVQDGTLDAIAIDHTPFTYEEKTVPFGETPPGAIGLELALPALWGALVEPGHLSALALWRSLSQAPANCLRQPIPTLQVGQRAEMTLFDPAKPWSVNASTLKSLSQNTSWFNQSITGQVLQVWC